VSQSHLISSAVNSRGLQSPVPAPGPLTGRWEKPEQRSLTDEAPLPNRSLFPTSAAPVKGERKCLEHVRNSQAVSLKQVESSKKTASSSNERSWNSERDRRKALLASSNPFERYNEIDKTVQKADDLLQDLGKLRREMHNILQGATPWKSDVNDVIKSKNPPEKTAPDPPEHHLLNKPSILQNVEVPRSILTDAERTLRGVQNNKKVLEENLEAVTHAKDGDAVYSISNSLTTNRDVLEEIRIRRTVDEWIKAISEEIQTEMARSDSEQGKYDQKAPWNKKAQNLKAVKTKIVNYFFFPFLVSHQGAVGGTALVQNEDDLSQVYGKPIYQGHRSTLKKGPYLRFNSPSPKSKLPRPKLIETVRG
ncbi:TALD3 protein, partial [Oxylabes madagascariensis]|nr:TALD3 protein [Oxylabes madagascariensis]